MANVPIAGNWLTICDCFSERVSMETLRRLLRESIYGDHESSLSQRPTHRNGQYTTFEGVGCDAQVFCFFLNVKFISIILNDIILLLGIARPEASYWEFDGRTRGQGSFPGLEYVEFPIIGSDLDGSRTKRIFSARTCVGTVSVSQFFELDRKESAKRSDV